MSQKRTEHDAKLLRAKHADKVEVRAKMKNEKGAATISAKDEKQRKSKAGNKRLFYVTVLNVLACFAVVALHCSNAAFWDFRTTRTWVTGNLVETLFYPAAPIFFMLSGVTLVDYAKRYDDKTFLKKRFSKTVIPFLFGV